MNLVEANTVAAGAVAMPVPQGGGLYKTDETFSPVKGEIKKGACVILEGRGLNGSDLVLGPQITVEFSDGPRQVAARGPLRKAVTAEVAVVRAFLDLEAVAKAIEKKSTYADTLYKHAQKEAARLNVSIDRVPFMVYTVVEE